MESKPEDPQPGKVRVAVIVLTLLQMIVVNTAHTILFYFDSSCSSSYCTSSSRGRIASINYSTFRLIVTSLFALSHPSCLLEKEGEAPLFVLGVKTVASLLLLDRTSSLLMPLVRLLRIIHNCETIEDLVQKVWCLLIFLRFYLFIFIYYFFIFLFCVCVSVCLCVYVKKRLSS